MSQWYNVAPADQFTTGEIERVEIDDDSAIAVFNINDEIFAVEDRCKHENVPIVSLKEEGFTNDEILDGYEMICPRHGGRICIKSGKAMGAPVFEDVATFPVRVEGGIVQVSDTPKE